MVEIDVFDRRRARAELPSCGEIRGLCQLALATAAVEHGHMAIEFVDPTRIAELNARYRGRPTPTDVLSFPIDGSVPAGGDRSCGERELGDVVICPQHALDVREAIVHGVLHLLGMDHETDDGEMLALQDELLGQGRE